MLDPIVFLPGMMCDERLFAPQIKYFGNSYPSIFEPLIGFDSIATLAQDILTRLPDRFGLLGLSMGGIVAMEILRIAPERVSRLALLDTNHLADPIERAPIRQAQVANALAGRLDVVMRDEMKPNYLADGPQKQPILDLCMEMAKDLGPQVFADQSNALQNRIDQSQTLRSVKVPTLILCGREDRLCPIERHELMRDLIPNADLEIIENAGHLPTLEAPEHTNLVIEKWLQKKTPENSDKS